MARDKPGNPDVSAVRHQPLEASVDQHFKDLLEASSLGTPAANQIRAGTPADVVHEVRRRMSGGSQEDRDQDGLVRRIPDSRRASRSPAARRVSRFLLALAGAAPKILDKIPGERTEIIDKIPGERTRLESLGWAILITSGMATISMWFALSSALAINGIAAVPVALLWGLVIMGIDRWLITSMPVGGSRKLAMAVPRVVLAMLLGALISTPLVLRIFQSEIDAQIAKMQQQDYNAFLQQQPASQADQQVNIYGQELDQLHAVIVTHGAPTEGTSGDPQLAVYEGQLANLNNQLAEWTSLRARYYDDYTCQLYGGPACPEKGNGPAAEVSRENYERAATRVTSIQSEINQVQGEIRQREQALTSTSPAAEKLRYQQAIGTLPQVQAEYNTAVQRRNQLQASFYAQDQDDSHGILIRLEALNQLSSGNPTLAGARFLLFLLFLVIECLPVTVKLLQPAVNYERILAREVDMRLKISLIWESQLQRLADAGQGENPPAAGTEGGTRSQDGDSAEQLAEPDNLRKEADSLYVGRADKALPAEYRELENCYRAISQTLNELLRRGYSSEQITRALRITADVAIRQLDTAQKTALENRHDNDLIAGARSAEPR